MASISAQSEDKSVTFIACSGFEETSTNRTEDAVDSAAIPDGRRPLPALYIFGFQFSVFLLALILAYFRKKAIPVIGYGGIMILGVVPLECIILSLLIVEMVL